MQTVCYLIAFFIIKILITLSSMHIMQLNSYNLDQQLIWYKKNKKKFVPFVILAICSLVSIIFYDAIFNKLNFNIILYFSLFFLIILTLLVIIIEYLPRKQKKKLVWTKRIVRLFIISLILMILPYVIYFVVKSNLISKIKNDILSTDIMEKIDFMQLSIITAVTPLLNFIAFLISLPIENAIRKKHMNEAKKILLDNTNITTIGITGSFGKTSVKNYLYDLLKQNYNTCVTPESFNTPMGATLTIKNNLKNYDDIFICEMGARRISDIKQMAEFVMPKHCIITEVGEQHLDTFKNLNNVLNTKFELADFIYNNESADLSYIFVNGDNELIKIKIAEYKNKNNKLFLTFGINKNNDFYAKDIVINENGTSFTFDFKNFYEKYKNLNIIKNTNDLEFNIKTKLLGEHNIKNLVVSIAFALLMNIGIDDIKHIIKNINNVPHRLEIKKLNNEVILIDDAYNSNVKGSKYAIDVLKSLDGYTKIVITPGIVELGNRQYELNKNFAIYASKNVDYFFAVGNTNKQALMDGIRGEQCEPAPRMDDENSMGNKNCRGGQCEPATRMDDENNNGDKNCRGEQCEPATRLDDENSMGDKNCRGEQCEPALCSPLHFDTFEQAYFYALNELKSPKKAILIENDLTDNY